MQKPHPLEGGIALLRGLIADRPELEHEFVTSREQFFCLELPAEPESAARLLADRRYLEWFVFEHTPESLGETPATALFDAWMDTADADARLFGDALLHSHTGVFEIKSVEPEVGFWVEDMLGHGAYPVDDLETSQQVQVGDIAAGRLFPVGDSQFRISPAVALYRNPQLREALARDLGAARTGLHRTLRISQAEIERMFFSAKPQDGDGATDAAAVDPVARRVKLVALLEEHGLESEEVEPWLEALTEVADDSGAVSALIAELMDRAAFESELDLDLLRAELYVLVEEARVVKLRADSGRAPQGDLPAAFSVVAELLAPPPGLSGRTPAAEDDESSDPKSREELEQALADFDAGRAAGKPLEQLFGQLERELGAEGETSERDTPAPDFPGVVGALVEEFLWERDAEGSALADPTARSLRDLAQRCSSIGVVDELDVQHLVDFAARWAIDAGKLGADYGADALLEGLLEFSQWTEESQQIPLWTAFRRMHEELSRELPRIAGVLAKLGRATPEQERRARLVNLSRRDGVLGAESTDGGFQPLESTQLERLGGRLEEGDVARLVDAGGAWQVVRVYPSAGRSV